MGVRNSPEEGIIFWERVARCKLYKPSAVSCEETAEPIDVPFGLWTRVDGRKHAARTKYRTHKNQPSAHHRTTLSGHIFATNARVDNWEKLLNSNTSSTRFHNMVNFGLLAAEIDSLVWGTPANFNGFRVLASLLQRRRWYQRKQTKLCTMFGRLLGWYNIYIYIFLGALAPLWNIVRRNIHFASMSYALLYLQRYCAALE